MSGALGGAPVLWLATNAVHLFVRLRLALFHLFFCIPLLCSSDSSFPSPFLKLSRSSAIRLFRSSESLVTFLTAVFAEVYVITGVTLASKRVRKFVYVVCRFYIGIHRVHSGSDRF